MTACIFADEVEDFVQLLLKDKTDGWPRSICMLTEGDLK